MEHGEREEWHDDEGLYHRKKGAGPIDKLLALGLEPDDAVRLAGWELLEQFKPLEDVALASMCEIHKRYRDVLEPRLEKKACTFTAWSEHEIVRDFQQDVPKRLRNLLVCGVAMTDAEVGQETLMKEVLTTGQVEETIASLRQRFSSSHDGYVCQEGMDIDKVIQALRNTELNPHTLWSLHQMEKDRTCPDVLAETADYYVVGECFGGTKSWGAHRSYHQALEEAKSMGIRMMGVWTFAFAFRHARAHGHNFLHTSEKLQREGKVMDSYVGPWGTCAGAVPRGTDAAADRGWRGELLVKKHPKVQQ